MSVGGVEGGERGNGVGGMDVDTGRHCGAGKIPSMSTRGDLGIKSQFSSRSIPGMMPVANCSTLS